MTIKKIHFTVMGTLLAVGWPLSGLAVQAALLVSLGMPDAALKAYLIQSRQAAIPLVIRGLYGASLSSSPIGHAEKNSLGLESTANPLQKNAINPQPSPLGNFRATAARLQQLMNHPAQGGVVIDPVLFRAFSVHAVPALVIYDAPLSCLKHANRTTGENVSCDQSHFDVAMGNLPLEKLLERIAQGSRSPERAAYAQQLRSRALKKARMIENKVSEEKEKNGKNAKIGKNQEDEKDEKNGENPQPPSIQGEP